MSHHHHGHHGLHLRLALRPLTSPAGHYEPYYIDAGAGYPMYSYPPTVMMPQPMVYAAPPVTYIAAPPPMMPQPTMVTTYTNTTTGPPPPPQVVTQTYTPNTTTTNPVMGPGQPQMMAPKPPGTISRSPFLPPLPLRGHLAQSRIVVCSLFGALDSFPALGFTLEG